MPDIMGKSDIAFPHLGIYLRDLGTGIDVFGFEITFYGMILALGVLAGLFVIQREAKLTGQNQDTYWDFAVYAIIFSIMGSRIYFVAFSWENYKDDLLSIFNLRGGGIAIYGTVIGGLLTLLIYSKIKKLSTLQMMDTCVFGLLAGQIIGRWGNFMNREAFGGYTDGLFAMRLPLEMVRRTDITSEIASHIVEGTNYIQVHPTYLYESLWNLALIMLMYLYRRHKKFEGEMGLIYLGGYGLGRAWIEGLRTDQLKWGHTDVAVSQVLAVIMLVARLLLDVIIRIAVKKGKWKQYLPSTTFGVKTKS